MSSAFNRLIKLISIVSCLLVWSACIRPLPSVESFSGSGEIEVIVAPQGEGQQGMDAELFEVINTIILFVFDSSAGEDCVSLESTPYDTLGSKTAFGVVALRPLTTNMEEMEHPNGVEGPYFRYVLNNLEADSYTMLVVGSSDDLPPEQTLDGTLDFAGIAADATTRFGAESIIARGCVQLQLKDHETKTQQIVLYADSNAEE